jgi:TM2 domain-containing membrane protein YozV
MKKIMRFRLVAIALLVSLSIVMSSSVPVRTADAAAAATSETPAVTTDNAGQKAGNTLTYKELKAVATQVKGSKLTFKEKLGLKLFGKKIATKFSKKMPFEGRKSQLVALLLCLFLGDLGIHRFYLGYIWQGIVQLLTLGGCGIWALIDFIRICTGHLQPKDGDYDVTL